MGFYEETLGWVYQTRLSCSVLKRIYAKFSKIRGFLKNNEWFRRGDWVNEPILFQSGKRLSLDIHFELL